MSTFTKPPGSCTSGISLMFMPKTEATSVIGSAATAMINDDIVGTATTGLDPATVAARCHGIDWPAILKILHIESVMDAT